MTPTSGTAPSDAWDVERARWNAIWLQRLERQLVRMTAHLQTSLRDDPQSLSSHQVSLITLLNRAHPYPQLHRRMVELIITLSPWPLRWGHWRSWEAMLRFALEVADVSIPASSRAALLDDLARLLFDTGRIDEALETAHEAVAQALAGEAPRPLGRAIHTTVDILRREGELDTAYAMLERAESRLEDARYAGYEIALAYLYTGRSLLLRQEGNLDEGIAWANRAVSLVESLSETEPHAVADIYYIRGVIHWGRGEYRDTIHDMEKAASLYAAIGDRYAESNVLGVLGLSYWSVGDYDRAEEVIRRTIAIAEQLNALQWLTVNVGNLGLVYLTRGEPSRALTYIEEHARLAKRIGDSYELMRATGNRGVVQIHLGEFEAALQALEEDARLAEQQGSREGRVATYVNLSRCLGHLGRLDEALDLANRAYALAQDSGSATARLAALRNLADWLPRPRRESLLREALRLARQTERRLDEAACYLSLAALKTGKERRRLWEQGVALLEDMNATAWVRGRNPDEPPCIPLAI